MQIKILGGWCPNCGKLEINVKKALENIWKDAEIIKITDIEEIFEHNISGTPALIIDWKIIFQGRVPDIQQIENALTK